jgi:hypothetical protein
LGDIRFAVFWKWVPGGKPDTDFRAGGRSLPILFRDVKKPHPQKAESKNEDNYQKREARLRKTAFAESIKSDKNVSKKISPLLFLFIVHC